MQKQVLECQKVPHLGHYSPEPKEYCDHMILEKYHLLLFMGMSP